MTIQQKSTNYADEQLEIVDPELSKAHYHRHTKMGLQRFTGSDIEQAYEEGANFVIQEIKKKLDQLREEDKSLWTNTYLREFINQLKQ
jgi:hypothetical protein